MPRTITVTLNYARLISTAASVTNATSQYTVGTRTTTPVVTNGVATQQDVLTDRSDLLQGGGAVTTPVVSTDTQGAVLQRIIGLICAAEGLEPTQGDRIYDNDGNRII